MLWKERRDPRSARTERAERYLSEVPVRRCQGAVQEVSRIDHTPRSRDAGWRIPVTFRLSLTLMRAAKLTCNSILMQQLTATKDPIQLCLDCFANAGLARSNPNASIQKLLSLFNGFCNAKHPNLYLFLTGVLEFMQDTDEPGSFTGLPPKISAVTTFAGVFTSVASMNQATSTPTVISRPTGGHGSSATVTSGLSIPTEYLSQVPKCWPYSEFGIGRMGETATWGLTDGHGKTVGVVKHKVLWYPRPLWTGYSRLLERCKPTYIVPGYVPTTKAEAERAVVTGG